MDQSQLQMGIFSLDKVLSPLLFQAFSNDFSGAIEEQLTNFADGVKQIHEI